MLKELDDVGKDKDLGWDPTTIIEEYGETSPQSKQSSDQTCTSDQDNH
jgi:hypothetical protein